MPGSAPDPRQIRARSAPDPRLQRTRHAGLASGLEGPAEQAAVDRDYLPGDVRPGVRAQVADEVAEVGGGAEAPKWPAAPGFAGGKLIAPDALRRGPLAEPAAQPVRQDAAGADQVHGDPVRGQFVCERLA